MIMHATKVERINALRDQAREALDQAHNLSQKLNELSLPELLQATQAMELLSSHALNLMQVSDLLEAQYKR